MGWSPTWIQNRKVLRNSINYYFLGHCICLQQEGQSNWHCCFRLFQSIWHSPTWHDGLLSKLKHYGIDDKIWTWISNFLKQRKQRVVVDGIQSDLATVDSGVPQGTVLGLILFLLHINDLPSVISSKVRLFADDCLVYREIKSRQDQNDLQKDLNLLETWGSTLGMRFTAAKCNIMRVSRK